MPAVVGFLHVFALARRIMMPCMRTHGARLIGGLSAAVGMVAAWEGGAGDWEAAIADRIQYEAPEGCPPKQQFLREVMRRADLGPTGASPLVESWRVHVEGQTPIFRGKLELAGPDGVTRLRALEADSCQDLVQVLALAAALSIHRRVVMLAELPRNQASVIPVAAVPPVRPRPEPPRHVPPQRWGVAAGASLGWVYGVFPETAWLPRTFVQVQRQGSGAWAPAFRLGLGATQQQNLAAGSGQASFGWMDGRAEACPVRGQVGTIGELHPCAFLDLGVFTASGSGVVAARRDTKPWGAVGGLVRAAISLRGPFVLEGAGGVLFPAYHTQYVIDPRTRVHTLPWAAGLVEIGVAWRLR